MFIYSLVRPWWDFFIKHCSGATSGDCGAVVERHELLGVSWLRATNLNWTPGESSRKIIGNFSQLDFTGHHGKLMEKKGTIHGKIMEKIGEISPVWSSFTNRSVHQVKSADHPGFDQLIPGDQMNPWACNGITDGNHQLISWALTPLTMASSSFSMATCVKNSWLVARPARRSNLFSSENVLSNLHDDSTEMHPPNQLLCQIRIHQIVRVYPACCSSPSKRFLKSWCWICWQAWSKFHYVPLLRGGTQRLTKLSSSFEFRSSCTNAPIRYGHLHIAHLLSKMPF